MEVLKVMVILSSLVSHPPNPRDRAGLEKLNRNGVTACHPPAVLQDFAV